MISDTHLPRGGRLLPGACLERLGAADAILHAGDFVSIGFLDELRELGPPVYGVHGNVDERAVREALPLERIVELGPLRIAMVHDGGARSGRPARLAARFPDCDAVVYGHTHVPEVVRHAGQWIVNPGSPTERRRAPFRAMALIEIEPTGIRPRLIELP